MGNFFQLFEKMGTIWGSSIEDRLNLPDLRGQFFRGMDNNLPALPVDPDRDSRVALRKGGAKQGNGSAQEFATSRFELQPPEVARPTRHWDNIAGATADKAESWNGGENSYQVHGGDKESRPVDFAVDFWVKCRSNVQVPPSE
jgi:hypothetical protein